jgi:hypothetical protein
MISLFLVLPIYFGMGVNAGGGTAGVGVLNVPPSYMNVTLDQQYSNLRLYLNISDYNSWEDIYEVKLILKYYGLTMATFTFKQYEDRTSYNKINEFSETPSENNLLHEDFCSFYSSPKKESIINKCNMDIRFVFSTTWFTDVKVITSDRAGATAETTINYNTEDLMRSSNMIMIPWFDRPIPVQISSLFLNIIAVAASIIVVIQIIRKRKLFQGASYGES